MEPYASESRKQEPNYCLNFDVLAIIVLELEKSLEVDWSIFIEAILYNSFFRDLRMMMIVALAARSLNFILSLLLQFFSQNLISWKLIINVLITLFYLIYSLIAN